MILILSLSLFLYSKSNLYQPNPPPVHLVLRPHYATPARCPSPAQRDHPHQCENAGWATNGPWKGERWCHQCWKEWGEHNGDTNRKKHTARWDHDNVCLKEVLRGERPTRNHGYGVWMRRGERTWTHTREKNYVRGYLNGVSMRAHALAQKIRKRAPYGRWCEWDREKKNMWRSTTRTTNVEWMRPQTPSRTEKKWPRTTEGWWAQTVWTSVDAMRHMKMIWSLKEQQAASDKQERAS